MKNKYDIFLSPQSLASLNKDTSVLLAYSGGADSSALLHLLKEDSIKNGYKLHAAHFNHQIRGDEANRDAEFCKKACEKLDIPFHLGTADIPSLAKENGNSIESEARERRYAFFEKVMRENNISILVTAHHAEDQIESIMLHILRGSGIAGLCGISHCRTFANNLFLVRPLLNAKKDDILSYCAENNIEFVTDSTNFDNCYARNFIRAELTPKMRELQPNLCSAFERLSSSANEANDFIDASANDFLDSEGENNISLSKFNELHRALKSRVLMLAFDKYSNGLSLESTHIKSIIELCQKAEPHSSLSLPGTIAARIENNKLVFTPDKEVDCDEKFDIPFAIQKRRLPNGIVINIKKNPTQNPSETDIFLDVKCDIINGDIRFRSKKEGDMIFSGKMNKKVKKLISEKKIPLNIRKKLPILVCGDEILWIPTVAICDRIKKDKINKDMDFVRISIYFES